MKTDPADLTLFLAQSVVTEPALVRLSRRGSTFLVRVSSGEEGRIIGRQGRVIQAIRTVLRTAFPNERINIDIEALRKQ
jgi:uncharacterized protein